MTKFNIQSLFFALIVLILVLIGGTKKQILIHPPEIPILQTKQTIAIKIPAINTQKNEKFFANLNEVNKPETFLISEANNFAKPKINAQAAIARILNDRTLFEININSRWPTASLTKLMTSTIALEKIGKNKKVPFTDFALNLSGEFKIFKNGDIFSVEDLIKSMLVVSRNDAAAALAEFYDEKNFVNEMNDKAKELGMKETAFSDPTGLSTLNQSTIEDLEKLINYIVKSHPLILEISRQKEIEITEINSGQKIRLANIIRFAGQSDFLGGKTGQTDEAKGNLISIFNYKNNPILIIVLGTDDRFGQTQILYDWSKPIIDSLIANY